MDEKFLITGGQGFIGSWISRILLEAGVPFIIFDHVPSNSILAQVVEPELLPSVPRVFGRVADPSAIGRILRDHRITRILHLAGLQEGPGAPEGPGGNRGVFQAVREHRGEPVAMTVYASVAGSAGEESARSFFRDHGIPSVGLRPHNPYGVGREAGPGSALTLAIKAAVLSRRFNIPFSGITSLSYVEDVARAFIAASRSSEASARALRLPAQAVPVEEFIGEIEKAIPESAGKITCSGEPLPAAVDLEEAEPGGFPEEGALRRTSLGEGIRRTAEIFRALAEAGRLHQRDL